MRRKCLEGGGGLMLLMTLSLERTLAPEWPAEICGRENPAAGEGHRPVLCPHRPASARRGHKCQDFLPTDPRGMSGGE